jgi:phosphatidylethanolamine/phosphatidyl-N-methylethanolamine N-methyltransferase
MAGELSAICRSSHRIFFRSLLLNPKAVGAVLPSSRRLARLIASRVDRTATVVEIGAGTGVITQALLDRGIHSERLFVVERDPDLAIFLRSRFPKIHVICADALHSHELLRARAISSVQTIVSSLPLRNLPHVCKIELLKTMLSMLSRGGQILQYTYGTGCPIPAHHFGMKTECLGRVWQNLPPAAVWRFF